MTTVEVDHVKELEQEVKNLSRLVREMAAREKLLTLRLQHLSKDHSVTAKQVKELGLTAKKIDARVAQVQAKR